MRVLDRVEQCSTRVWAGDVGVGALGKEAGDYESVADGAGGVELVALALGAGECLSGGFDEESTLGRGEGGTSDSLCQFKWGRDVNDNGDQRIRDCDERYVRKGY